MGRSGNQPGYKVFSISTTIRNPKRNIEFLELLQEFDGKQLTDELKNSIYFELIRRGIYQLTNLTSTVKEKYESGELLSDDEIKQAIAENPQKTKDAGRLMTQIRAIKDTGLLALTGDRNKKTMTINQLGKDLLAKKNSEDVYAKAMIGMHAKNPMRNTIYNNSRPFLNTLFVIKELNDINGNNKGILWHEFAVFILSMKDCDYKNVAQEIMKYRKANKNKINKVALENYLYNQVKVNKVEFKSILKDYADDVYRKFDMTGLIEVSGFFPNVYIRFNQFNIDKVESILLEYKDYKYETFDSPEKYNEYLTNIYLPWEKSDEVKEKIVKHKKELLKAEIDTDQSLDQQLIELDNIYNKQLFDKDVEKIDMDLLTKELIILGRNGSQKSVFDEIPEPLRFEWLTAIFIAKVYGTQYVKPNLSLDQDGLPKSYACGGFADIEFISEKLYCLIEVTLQRDYKQQENNETTSIADHLRELDTTKEKQSILIAPRIHKRVVDYFKYCARNDLVILALTIEKFIDTVMNNRTIEQYIIAIKESMSLMESSSIDDYTDSINSFRISEKYFGINAIEEEKKEFKYNIVSEDERPYYEMVAENEEGTEYK